MSFKLHTFVSSTVKSYAVLLLPTWDENHPIVLHIHSMDATPSQSGCACVQVAIILLTGLKAQRSDEKDRFTLVCCGHTAGQIGKKHSAACGE
jgi:hypothetical protein